MVEQGDEVELTKSRIGTIRYKGELHGKNGIFYGIELTKGEGKHSGLFKGQRYFSCEKDKGIFVDKTQILYKLEAIETEEKQKLMKRKEEWKQKINEKRIAASTNYQKIKSIPSDKVDSVNGYLRQISSDHVIPDIVIYTTILYYYAVGCVLVEGDEVELTKDRIGILRYKGELYGKVGIFYGIELTKGKGKHSGLFKGKRYFRCEKGKGVFVDKKQILYKLEPKRKKVKRKKRKSSNKSPWKPPSWPNYVFDNDGGFLDYIPKKAGKAVL